MTHLALFPFLGSAAVMGFFILSGYLMTYVMQQTYGYHTVGMQRFAINRFLRLFPSYWASLLISLAIILALGPVAVSDYRTALGIPADAVGWLANLTMIYPSILPNTVEPRLSPATWALTIELLYYALIALGASRNRMITWIWFAIGLGWHIWFLVGGLAETWQYHFIGAGALPFATGALVYHYRAALAKMAKRPVALLAAGCGLFAVALAAALYSYMANIRALYDFGFYLNLVAQAICVIALANLDLPRWRKLDSVVGDWSYHIYILHWATGALWAVGLFGLAAPGRNLASVMVVGLATLTAIGISFMLTWLIDHPVQKLRQGFKPKPAA